MYNHAPQNYQCPLCIAIQGIENEHTLMKQADIVYRNNDLIVCVNSKFVKNNPGHVIIFPINHYENLYDLPYDIGHQIFDMAKFIALALKDIRKCDGITLLQNNEPASDQHAFHFHLHVFPRFQNDQLHQNMINYAVLSPEDRKPYADKLREYLSTHKTTSEVVKKEDEDGETSKTSC
jgi:histidine triad (HIT) family protein